ncbi:glycosyltransferase [Conexibacter sp. JD483]|uniref:glycosyltransferase family protein n=1 Tax=unclassified Conexibacter TaxID=2627773 RepID=UPI0027168212|nr:MULTISPECIES: glycosyltransferase [unclassified Conexibacter]MDO8188893.1 glycosyltransferase [Conexibacter sp. CPCC 205706]MDO8201683.1 glycosyltransferase [Conexibacter sp. CPCC 205762]MDR9372145.1 glycosyltransferase [Conexibacter sp. JD483]
MPLQIVSLVPEGAPSSLYRSFIPMQALALSGHRVHVEERNELGDPAQLRDVDVVHMFRLMGPGVEQFTRQLRDDGVAVVWDNDFDVSSAPADHPVGVAVAEAGIERELLAAEQAMLALATLVTVPTAELAERYRAAGAAEVEVLPNLLPPQFQRRGQAGADTTTIGYAAMQEHAWDYERVGAATALRELLEQRPELRLLAIGLDLGIDDERCEQLPWQPYDDLPALLSRCDVALAPLADVPFNRTRSNVKLKEYAACGVPWLASPVGEYAQLGQEHGGRHVADGDWVEQIGQLLDAPAARQRLADAGRGWTDGNCATSHTQVLERIFARADDLSDY